MPKFERQCQVCGHIYEMNHWTPEKGFKCNSCKRLEKKSDNKAIRNLKKMKKKLGAPAA